MTVELSWYAPHCLDLLYALHDHAAPGFDAVPTRLVSALVINLNVAVLPILEATLDLIRCFIPIPHSFPRQYR